MSGHQDRCPHLYSWTYPKGAAWNASTFQLEIRCETCMGLMAFLAGEVLQSYSGHGRLEHFANLCDLPVDLLRRTLGAKTNV